MPSPDTAEKAWDERNEEGLRNVPVVRCPACGGTLGTDDIQHEDDCPNAKPYCEDEEALRVMHGPHEYEQATEDLLNPNFPYCARCGNVKEHEIHDHPIRGT